MDAINNAMKKYVLNITNLKPGDIILEHGYKPHSYVIMAATNSHYSHAMLYEGGTIIEATSSGGVFSKVPNRFAVINKNDLKVLRLADEISWEKMREVTLKSRTLVGSSYDKNEVLKVGRKNKPNQRKTDGQFCSRLVAQCYNEIGIKLTDNIDYCSPGDLERSSFLREVDDAVKEASEAELAHALGATIHKQHRKSTVEWVKAAKKILKKSDVKVETINEIYAATIRLRNKKVDKLILKEIRSSGHYDFYLEDRVVNSYRYDVASFSQEVGASLDRINSEIYKEISILENQSINLKSSRDFFRAYPSCLFNEEVKLYLGILNATNERLKVIYEHCKSNGLEPDLLPEASEMITYIENL